MFLLLGLEVGEACLLAADGWLTTGTAVALSAEGLRSTTGAGRGAATYSGVVAL